MGLALLVNDPEHAPPSAPWMRGITPVRIATFVFVCLVLTARPALWNFDVNHAADAVARWQSFWLRYLCFGLPLFVLVIKADLWSAHASGAGRVASFAAAVLAGAFVFAFAPSTMPLTAQQDFIWQYQLGYGARAIAMGALMAAVLHFARRERDTEREMHRLRVESADSERQAADAKLHVLHAQIEPHFLFNSLASIKRLYEREPGSGRAMLRNLGTYVTTATVHAGRMESRLGEEISLAKAFLDIVQVRMGARLGIHIDVPARLESALVPSLVVGTLVENAIKHGIAPRADGGVVGISARLAERRLVIEVRDNGVGFRARSGHGIGLANTRARLHAMFRDTASLELAKNPDGGVTASVSLPCRFA